MSRSSRLFATLAVVMAVLMMTTPAAAANASSKINFDADATPNPQYGVELTKESHNLTWDSPLRYENDDGKLVLADAEVNGSIDNPYEFYPTHVAADDFGAFPHNKDNVSALTVSEWTVDATNTNATTTLVDASPATGVDGIQFATSSQTSGETTVFEFSNFSIENDIEKKHLATAVDVAALDAGAVVEVRAVDDNGDYYAADINSSRTSGSDLIANSTGTGFVFQEQMGQMDLVTAGDGSVGTLEKVQIVVKDGDADITMSMLNLEKLSKYKLGTRLENTDSDDELETVDIYEKNTSGKLALRKLTSMGSWANSAEIKGLTFDANFTAEKLSADAVKVEFKETGNKYPSYFGTVTVQYRMQLPDVYDLDYAFPTLDDSQSVTRDRVLSVEVAEGVSNSTAFEDIESWTDKTAAYTGLNKSITLDDTVQPGQYTVIKFEYKVTEDQYTAMQPTLGGPGFSSDDGGIIGFFSGFVNYIAAGVATIAVSIGLISRKSGA
ncbi:hypothetical protein E6P09_07595 [Haloferax mediterranei ATCC 33500]|uniref:Uncharacterized protein n=1 Tax=Haloferax mediterranei (strain ATCC 33500 / DSM 1411 / JCM 8866 / NBRC 14739 / NCIMB 2177 / R-4) TaxID=523841 RepID=I3R321_HALMT|nr:hypothetical protein [Haloferax mediterranei]AFK18631.1 hypothetical protein HFX_0910 [Haloferax mediterranei ATCC 33500]AHZ21997.1 hypothetical protein BM92_04665 [Haloferax mediterranei ATCC 33500]EMA02093.1 hypothetical protein C439_05920 [Haloferax mediterranei ATCC 33500]MDX5988724.1 hypothetical protein [Haloferax mediterranei ATCC 33500]QCQ75131.1 hypothetical protein E6P09_07595 [Haloferax mediterranei ATCC 33500]